MLTAFSLIFVLGAATGQVVKPVLPEKDQVVKLVPPKTVQEAIDLLNSCPSALLLNHMAVWPNPSERGPHESWVEDAGLLPRDVKLRTRQRVCEVMHVFLDVPTELIEKLARWADFEVHDQGKPDYGPRLAYLKRNHIKESYWLIAIDDIKLKVLMLIKFLFKPQIDKLEHNGNSEERILWTPYKDKLVFNPEGWYKHYMPNYYLFVPSYVLGLCEKVGRRPSTCKAVVSPPAQGKAS